MAEQDLCAVSINMLFNDPHAEITRVIGSAPCENTLTGCPIKTYNSKVHLKVPSKGMPMQTLPFSEARAQLAHALRSVEAGNEPFSISRRGQVAGVLMSFEQYQRMSGVATGFAEKLKLWRAESLNLPSGRDEDDPFADVRQKEGGREFSW